MNMNVIEIMERTGIVPVFYDGDAGIAKGILGACYAGGIRAFEFTDRGEKAFEVFVELAAAVEAEYPDMVLGIGSVVDRAACRRFVEAGARFVVSPVFAGEVMDEARKLGVPYIPGAATPTEIFDAHRAGAEIVKLFPAAQIGGPAFVKAILAPMPRLRLMVTGGVEPTRENLEQWFAAGVACVGIGSNLFPRDLVEAGRWEEIAAKAAEAVKIVQEFKSRNFV